MRNSRLKRSPRLHMDVERLIAFVFGLMISVVVVPPFGVDSDALADGTWLAALYNATNGVGWGSGCASGWNITNPGSVCGNLAAWSRVQCSSGVVTSVDLNGCKLQGGSLPEIPPLVSGHSGTALQRCKYLDLSSNSLTGSLPSSFSSMQALQTLSLHHNELTGSLPPFLSSMHALRTLFLHYNSITGILPISYGNMSSLESLDLGHNRLTGTIPSSYGNMTSLVFLAIGYNTLHGTIPSSFSGMRALQRLYLEFNNLTGTLTPLFHSMTSLQILCLFSNTLTGSLPTSYGSMSSLQQLSLHSNSLSGSLPSGYSGMSSLQILSLHNNNLSGSLPSTFSSLSSLQILSLQSNNLSGTLPSTISSLTSLQALDLSFNSLTGSLPTSWSSLVSLRILYLNSNALTGSLPSSWYTLLPLAYGYNWYDVTSNHLKGEVPSTWLWRNATIGGSFFSGNMCLKAVTVSAIVATGRFVKVEGAGRNASAAGGQCDDVLQPKLTMSISAMPPRHGDMASRGPFSTVVTSLAALASMVTASSAQFILQRSSLVLRLLACQLSLDDRPDVMTSPTQLQIGSDVLRYQRGTVIGNICVLVGITLGSGLLCGVLTVLRGGRTVSAWWHVAGLVHLPGWLVVVWSILLQPLVAAITCLLLLQPVSAVNVGIAGISFVVLVLTLEVRLLLFRFRAQWRRRASMESSLLSIDPFSRRLFSFLKSWRLFFTSRVNDDDHGWHNGVAFDKDDEPYFVEHYGAVFEANRPGSRRLFHLVDSLFAIVSAVLQAVATVRPSRATSPCSGDVLFTLCALQVIYFMMVALWRPQAKTSEYIMAATMSCLSAASALLAVIPTCVDGWCGSMAVEIAQVQVYLAFADLCATLVSALWTGRAKRCLQRIIHPEWNDGAPVTLWREQPMVNSDASDDQLKILVEMICAKKALSRVGDRTYEAGASLMMS